MMLSKAFTIFCLGIGLTNGQEEARLTASWGLSYGKKGVKGKKGDSGVKGKKGDLVEATADGCPVPDVLEVSRSGKKSKKGHNQCGFDSHIVLGDSLADVGSGNTFPFCSNVPQDDSSVCLFRSSSGFVAVDFISGAFGLGPTTPALDGSLAALITGGNNFAIEGSTATSSPNPLNPATFEAQVILYTQSSMANPSTPRRLHTAVFGANDVTNAFYTYSALVANVNNNVDERGADSVAYGVIQGAVDGVTSSIDALLNLPGVCNVAIVGTVDMGTIPRSKDVNAFYGQFGIPVLQKATEYSQFFVQSVITAIEAASADFDAKCAGTGAEFGIIFADSAKAFADILAGDEFEIVDQGCNSRFTSTAEVCDNTTSQLLMVPGESNYLPLSPDGSKVGCFFPTIPNVELDCTCEGYAFLDELHPSEGLHELIAATIVDVLEPLCNMDY